jgi:hypothetical protein
LRELYLHLFIRITTVEVWDAGGDAMKNRSRAKNKKAWLYQTFCGDYRSRTGDLLHAMQTL